MRLLILLVLLPTPPQAPPPVPRDPLRFLNIQEWHGEAAVVLKGSKDGNSVDRRFSTKFRIEMPVGVRASFAGMAEARKRMGANLPPQMLDVYNKLLKEVHYAAAPGKKEEHCELSVRDAYSAETTTAAPPPETRALKGFLKMDLVGGTYDLRIDGWDEVEMTVTPRKGPVQKVKRRALYGGDARKQPLPTDKDVLSGRVPASVSVAGLYLNEKDLESYFEWTLSPEPLPELELAVDIPGYETWLPEGKEDGFGVGNELEIKAEFRGKGGATLKEKCLEIRFLVMATSLEPGSATNAPKEGGTEFDLRFDPALNPGLEIKDDGRRAMAKDPGRNAAAKLSCRDFGAYGELVVVAYTDIGRFVEGTTPLQPGDARIRVPKRAKDSKIADAWKKGRAEGKADDVDDDAQPAGPKVLGDGLTLYEEYRGFFVAGKHVRTDPDKRDLFVLTRTDHAKVKAGVALFQKASGLEVHLDQNEQLLKERRLNYNTKYGLGGPQHGVVIMGFTPALTKSAVSRTVAPDGDSGGTPKDFRQIEFAPDLANFPAQTASWSGTKATGPDVMTTTVAHELAHAVAVRHHGDDWDYSAVWKVRAAGGGRFAVTELVGDVEMPISVIREDGKPYPWTKEQDLGVNIGVFGGVNSGAWDCLMRYSNANAYVLSTDRSVRVDIHNDEIGGTVFCKDKKGTGPNDEGRKPYHRFGDARKGNCLEQIKIKDWGP